MAGVLIVKLELGKTYLVRGGKSGRDGQRGVLVDLNAPPEDYPADAPAQAPVLDFGKADLAHVEAADLVEG